jgi:hypothetical protein
MSILDDAIREHLELKRAHGADEAELKRLEDEAFGLPGRPEEPDPFAEAPTEFMTAETGEGAEATTDEAGGRRINIADLQEPPPPEAARPAEVDDEQEAPRVEATEATEAIEPAAEEVPIVPAEDAVQAAAPAEEPPIAEEAEDAPVAEREAIAEQPTELFDVEAELGTEDAPATEAASPSDEEIVAAELNEPKLAPADPPTEIHATRTSAPDEPLPEEEEDEEFWGEQRLSDELDKALEAPIADEAPLTDEEELPTPSAVPSLPADDPVDDEEPRADFDPDTGHEDVLEDTPEFLEDAPEDDELWFEQRPPKDFDFDD